jgi:hypothetical protein
MTWLAVALLALALLAAPLAVEAQPGKVPRVGLLRPGAPPDPYVEAFRQGLRDLGSWPLRQWARSAAPPRRSGPSDGDIQVTSHRASTWRSLFDTVERTCLLGQLNEMCGQPVLTAGGDGRLLFGQTNYSPIAKGTARRTASRRLTIRS